MEKEDAYHLKTMELSVIAGVTKKDAETYVQYLYDTSGPAMIKRSMSILNKNLCPYTFPLTFLTTERSVFLTASIP